jgi:PadR family transcriptional regulator PadR
LDAEINNLVLDSLLTKWEGVYKKGLLSFWILLLLNERPAYAYEMANEIHDMSQGTMTVDEKSLYRALNRFESAGILHSEKKKSDVGPARRYYFLSDLGKELLVRFTKRNVLVFKSPGVGSRIERLVNADPVPDPSSAERNPT